MSAKGRVELTPEDLGELADACRSFLAAYEASHEGIPEGVEVHMQAPRLLHDALAEVVACAGVIYSKFTGNERRK